MLMIFMVLLLIPISYAYMSEHSRVFHEYKDKSVYRQMVEKMSAANIRKIDFSIGAVAVYGAYRVRYHERVFTVKMPALKSLAELIRPGLLNYIEKQRQKL
jgi:hypothetical protein